MMPSSKSSMCSKREKMRGGGERKRGRKWGGERRELETELHSAQDTLSLFQLLVSN
jgi:hypothetical protein